jgi:hypothetical protein
VFFKKGSDDLSREGESRLADMARMFRSGKYIIRVEGHTDSLPVRKTKPLYKDNWGLSAARAASVIRYFNKQGNIPGERLMGVFFSKYRPLETDDPKKGSAKNRRVEIRLVPPYFETGSPLSMTKDLPFDKPLPEGERETFLDSKKPVIRKPVKEVRKPIVKEVVEKPVGIIPKKKKDEPAVKVEDKDEKDDDTVIIVK